MAPKVMVEHAVKLVDKVKIGLDNAKKEAEDQIETFTDPEVYNKYLKKIGEGITGDLNQLMEMLVAEAVKSAESKAEEANQECQKLQAKLQEKEEEMRGTQSIKEALQEHSAKMDALMSSAATDAAPRGRARSQARSQEIAHEDEDDDEDKDEEGQEDEEELEAVIKKLEKDPLCERRGFANLPKLEGNLDAYPEWRFALRGLFDREATLGRRLTSLEQHVLELGRSTKREDFEESDFKVKSQRVALKGQWTDDGEQE